MGGIFLPFSLSTQVQYTEHLGDKNYVTPECCFNMKGSNMKIKDRVLATTRIVEDDFNGTKNGFMLLLKMRVQFCTLVAMVTLRCVLIDLGQQL